MTNETFTYGVDLQYTSDGGDKAYADIQKLIGELDQLDKKAGATQQEYDDLFAKIRGGFQSLTEASQAFTTKLSSDLEAANRHFQEFQKAQVAGSAVNLRAQDGGLNPRLLTPAKLSMEEVAELNAFIIAGTRTWAQEVARLDAEYKRVAETQERSRQALQAAQRQVSQTERGISYEQEIEQLDRVEQAQRRYEDSSKRVARAREAINRAKAKGDVDAETQATLRLDKALRSEETARKALNRALSAEEAELKKVADAQERAEKAQARLDTARQTEDASALTRATARLSDALKEQAIAQEAVDRAVKPSDVIAANKQLETATNGVTQAVENHVRAREAENRQLQGARYAYYDVAQSSTVMTAALLAMPVAAGTAAIGFEAAFADVRRTTGIVGDEAARLEQQFVDLSTTMPVAFSDISEIGALAGQLGIANSKVADFTETTAQFTATTDVTLDAAATAFGRLDALIPGVSGNFAGLGSAILNVGINSVATESNIVSQAVELAAVAGQAGMTADEIIGLAGAFASLGSAPETARSTMIRFFNIANEAVQTGSDKLRKFAELAGMTGEEFQNAFRTDFMGTFVSFLEGLNEQGSQATASIRELGITSVRDANNIARLSQNVDFLKGTLSDANTGFNDSSILAENYGIIAETTAAKLQVLWQNFQALAAEVGKATTGPLGVGIDALTAFLRVATDIAASPIGQVFSGAAVGIAIFGAAAASLVAIMSRAAGAMTTFQTMQANTAGTSKAATAGITGFRSAVALVPPKLDQVTASTTRWATANSAVLRTLAPLQAGLVNVRANAAATATAMTGAAGATAAFGAAVKTTGVGLLITGGLVAVTAAVDALSDSFKSAREQAEEFSGGTLDSLASALQADNVDYFAERMENLYGATEDTKDANENWVQVLRDTIEAQQNVGDSVSDANTAIDEQTLKVGENTTAWLQQQLIQNEAFRELFENLDQYDALTSGRFTAMDGTTFQGPEFDMQHYVQLAAEQGEEAALAYYESWVNELNAAYAAAGGDPIHQGMVQEYLTDLEAGYLHRVREIAKEIANTMDEGKKEALMAEAVELLGGSLDDASMSADEFAESVLGASATVEELYAALAAGGSEGAQAFSILTDQAFAANDAAFALTDNMYALGEAFANNGVAALQGGDAIQAVLQSIYETSTSTPQAAANMINFYNSLIEGGYATAEQLAVVKTTIDSVVASAGGIGSVLGAAASMVAQQAAGLSVPKFDFQPFISGLNSVGQAAAGGGGGRSGGSGSRPGGAAGEIRTLIDYARDLQSVMSRSFELRFSVMLAKDGIQDTFDKMREDSRKAKEQVRDLQLSIRELRAEMQGTQASLSTNEYFLSIAREYGDTQRVMELEAERAKLEADLAKQRAELADQQKELADANNATSKSLKGNSKQARANRKTVTDLVSEYQDQIAALAKSGMSQKDLQRESQRLRAEFVRQLTQMGFNRKEVEVYARAFDDMGVAVQRVPRNITVSANANPALQALAEFEAKMRSSMDRAARSAGGGVGRINKALRGIKTPSIGVNVANGYNAGYNLGSQIRSGVKSYMGNHPILMEAYAKQGQKRYRVPGTNIELYSRGGYTGAGGKYDPAGIVHRGEYVIPKHGVNQATGLPKPEYMNSLGQPHRGSRASYASGGYVGGGNSGIMVVELSAADRKAIANSKSPVNVVIGNETVARAANAANLTSANNGRN